MAYKKILIILIILALGSLPFLKLKKEAKKTLTLWTIQLKAPAGDIIQKNIDFFEKKHPEINIVWVDIPISEAQKRAIASVLGGNPPDIINLNPEFSLLLAQKNTLEFFDEKDAKDYNQSLVNKLKFNDKIYALPFYATSPVTVLNKEKFKNCKIQLKTYDDILKLKTCKNPPVFGINLNENDTFAKILNKYDIYDGNNDRIKDIYFLFKKMNDENLLLKDTLTINHRELVEKYMAQNAAFIITGSNFLNIIKENAPDVYEKSVIIPQLTGAGNKFDISLMNFIIPKNSKNKELAKEFIHLLLNEENQLEFSKKTNTLPVNKYALQDEYFTNCSNNIEDLARCEAKKQLDNALIKDFGYKNKKEINETINQSLEILFLEGEGEFSAENLKKDINLLQN